jgi:hypothetical protein
MEDVIKVHRCDYCRRIKFQITNPHSAKYLSFPYQDVLNYAGDRCDFFARTLRELDSKGISGSLKKI